MGGAAERTRFITDGKHGMLSRQSQEFATFNLERMLLAPWEGHWLSTCRGLPRTVAGEPDALPGSMTCCPTRNLTQTGPRLDPNRFLDKSQKAVGAPTGISLSPLQLRHCQGFVLWLCILLPLLSAQHEAGAPGAGWAFPPTPPTHCIFPHLPPPPPPCSSRTKQAVLRVELCDPQKMCWGS